MAEGTAAIAKPNVEKRSLKTWLTLVKSATSSWLDDYAPSMGAALSYYTVFSLAPLLLIVVSVAGLVFGEDAVRGELFAQLQGLMGADAAHAVQGLLAGASREQDHGNGSELGARSNRFQEPETVEPWHHRIAQHQVGFLCLYHRQGRDAVGCRDHFEPG